MYTRSGRYAFTLVELLVVLTIIGVLLGLLLPAVQAAREAARILSCKNNLKQLSLAGLNYESVHVYFPAYGGERIGSITSVISTANEQMRGANWISKCLPFAEQDVLGQHWGRLGNTTEPITDPEDRNWLATPIDFLHCPSRRTAKAYPIAGDKTPRFFGLTTAARTDYAIAGGAGSPGTATNINHIVLEQAGVWQMGRYTRSNSITDGLSNTYFIGEKSMDPRRYDSGDDHGDFAPAAGSGPSPLEGGTSFVRFAARNALGDRDVPKRSASCTSCHDFGSAHPSTWNVAMIDGSVRGIAYTQDFQVHYSQASIAGGEVIGNP